MPTIGSQLIQAAHEGYELLLTGEAEEPSLQNARELGIHLIAAGHHATERLGVAVRADCDSFEAGVAAVRGQVAVGVVLPVVDNVNFDVQSGEQLLPCPGRRQTAGPAMREPAARTVQAFQPFAKLLR